MFAKQFHQVDGNDELFIGGKAKSLCKLINCGLPVPQGFVILSTTLDTFLKENNADAVIYSLIEEYQKSRNNDIPDKIQQIIMEAKYPVEIEKAIVEEFAALGINKVAVRSSALAEDGKHHSFAGQYTSILNVSKDTLLQDVKECWASAFSKNVLNYRIIKDINSNVAMAVVVQRMVNAEKAGVTFSTHPITGRNDQVLLEAVLGLGEALVSGKVTPDTYVVNKTSAEVAEVFVSKKTKALYTCESGVVWNDIIDTQCTKPILLDKEIRELTNLAVKIERHYHFPVDVEWAISENQIFIVQARPITTIDI